jgi:hypothetical protein
VPRCRRSRALAPPTRARGSARSARAWPLRGSPITRSYARCARPFPCSRGLACWRGLGWYAESGDGGGDAAGRFVFTVSFSLLRVRAERSGMMMWGTCRRSSPHSMALQGRAALGQGAAGCGGVVGDVVGAAVGLDEGAGCKANEGPRCQTRLCLLRAMPQQSLEIRKEMTFSDIHNRLEKNRAPTQYQESPSWTSPKRAAAGSAGSCVVPIRSCIASWSSCGMNSPPSIPSSP